MSGEGIPEFLKRKPAPKEATMSDPATTTPAKPKKAAADKPKAKVATTAAPKPEKATSEAPKGKQLPIDAYGFNQGCLKSRAAAMYAAESGATVAEVKAATGSLQLNLLKQLEKDGCTIKRVKEKGTGARQVTRYFLTK